MKVKLYDFEHFMIYQIKLSIKSCCSPFKKSINKEGNMVASIASCTRCEMSLVLWSQSKLHERHLKLISGDLNPL